MTRKEDKCIEELNEWYHSKKWKVIINFISLKGPFGYYNNKIHCFMGIMTESINIKSNKIPDKYVFYLLKVIESTLHKYNIKNMGFGSWKFKYENQKWIKNGRVLNEKE